MIAGLEFPTTGDILVGGRRVNDVPIHKRNLGLVFQNYALFPHKTIGENIAFGLKYRGVPKEDARKKVTEALNIVRLPGVEERFPTQLSGGQQQLVGVARAIVGKPKLLLADEPTGNLHSSQGEEVMDMLKQFNKEGMTIIQVTHNEKFAEYGSRVIELEDGALKR